MTEPRDPPAATRELGHISTSWVQSSPTHGFAARGSIHRLSRLLAIGLPTLTVVFAVVMAGFLLAETIADAVATRVLRIAGITVLLLLIVDSLMLACILSLGSRMETPSSAELGSASPDAPASPYPPKHNTLASRVQNRE